MRTKIAVLASIITASLNAHALTAEQDIKASSKTTQRYIVKLNDNVIKASKLTRSAQPSLATINQIIKQTASSLGVQAHSYLPSINAMSVELSAAQKQRLETHPNIAMLELDPKRYLSAESMPYGIEMVQATALSDQITGNRTVCIIDTGYTLSHPDLPTSNVTGVDGYGGYDSGNWYEDGFGHGTHVAGTIAAVGGNNLGVVGVNPSAKLNLHIVKVFNASGDWVYGSKIINALQDCTTAGANVVNLSLGGSTPSQVEELAFENAYARGILSIAAAGNNGSSRDHFPASYNAVVSVGAVDENEKKASFSQYPEQVELAAPGVNIESTFKDGKYVKWNGTSMATPHVTGVAALLWSYFPECTNQHIRSALTSTAKDKGLPGRDPEYGFGIVQAKSAYDYLLEQGCATLPIPEKPVANFSFALSDKQVSFTNLSTDNKPITRFHWQFGDGSESTLESPQHTYSGYGIYQVMLTVVDSDENQAQSVWNLVVDDQYQCALLAPWNANTSYGAGKAVRYKDAKYVSTYHSRGATPDVYTHVWSKKQVCGGDMGNQAPVADFSVAVDKLAVIFSNASTDDKGIIAYHWEFGDGQSSDQIKPVHTYAQAGQYNVSLRVQDQEGLSSELIKTVTLRDQDDDECDGLALWQSYRSYQGGERVSHNGYEYEAKWWTRNNDPEQFSEPSDVWINHGECK